MVFQNSPASCLAALLILSCSLWSGTTAHGDEAEDCCLSTSDRPIPSRVVKSFIVQTGDGACRIPATIFVTRKGLKLCAPFPDEENWVRRLIEDILSRPATTPRKPRGRKPRQL